MVNVLKSNQICLLNENFLKINDLQAFEFILIKLRSLSCVCRVLVYSKFTQQDSINISLFVCNKIISDRNIQLKLNEQPFLDFKRLVSLQQIDEISIDIFVDDQRDKIAIENTKNFLSYCQILLFNLCIGHEFYVNFGVSKLTPIINIRHIRIHLSVDIQEKYGYITNKTKISINKISILKETSFQVINFNQFSSHSRRLLDLISIDQEHLLFIPSILLWGPPSCGKLTLVETCSNIKNFHFFPLLAIDVFKHREMTDNLILLSKKVEEVLTICRSGKKCVLLFKNLEEFIGNNRIVREIIDDIINYNIDVTGGNLVVIASTNNLSAIDLIFDHEIMVGYPNFEDRKFLISTLYKENNFQLGKVNIESKNETINDLSEINFQSLASKTSGYSVGDLLNFHRNAAFLEYIENKQLDESTIDGLLCVQGAHTRCDHLYVDQVKTSWDDLIGCEDVKKELTEAIIWPLKNPGIYAKFGLSPDSGILLHGPPGCGKTMIIRALASHLGINFIPLSAAQLYSPYLGDSEKKLNEIFVQSRSCAPCIIFIDELDSVVGSRSGESGGDVHRRMLTSLLTQIDGIGDRLSEQTWQDECSNENRVILVAASNRLQLIDSALRRRFNRVIYVGPPDTQSRLNILKQYTEKMSLLDVDLNHLSENTDNFTGADIENLCKKAFMMALSNSQDLNNIIVTKEHFDASLLTTKPSIY